MTDEFKSIKFGDYSVIRNACQQQLDQTKTPITNETSMLWQHYATYA